MFPIPWDFPFRKKNGDLSTISDVINSGGGGGSDLPPHDVGDAGKLLGVDSAGKLEWTDDVSSEIQTLTNNVDVLAENGAVNLLPNGVTTDTINGVTFTVNNDGTVTANGEATATATFTYYVNSDGSKQLLGKLVKLSGCPSGGDTTSTYSIQAYRVGAIDGSTGNFNDLGEGVEFTWLNNGSGTLAKINLIVRSGYTANNLIFKPMIADAKYSGPYVPYAKTNRELTEDVSDIIGNTSIDRLTLLDPQPTECVFDYAHIYDNGIMFQTSGLITLSTDIATNEFIKVGTVAEGHRPTVDRTIQCAKISGTGTVYGSGLVIKSNGDVTFNVRPGMKNADQFLAYGACIK